MLPPTLFLALLALTLTLNIPYTLGAPTSDHLPRARMNRPLAPLALPLRKPGLPAYPAKNRWEKRLYPPSQAGRAPGMPYGEAPPLEGFDGSRVEAAEAEEGNEGGEGDEVADSTSVVDVSTQDIATISRLIVYSSPAPTGFEVQQLSTLPTPSGGPSGGGAEQVSTYFDLGAGPGLVPTPGSQNSPSGSNTDRQAAQQAPVSPSASASPRPSSAAMPMTDSMSLTLALLGLGSMVMMAMAGIVV